MQFIPTAIEGVWLIRSERRSDVRGHFVRTFCADEFAKHGLPEIFVQCNLSYNVKRATLRGLHWQADPFGEGKLVRCARGGLFDVAVDLRAASPTYGAWVAAELTADNGDALYIPPGFAHGFQTLADHTEVHYQMSVAYQDGLARGLRWNDPTMNITWPIEAPLVSERDAKLPFLAELDRDT